MLCLPAGAKYKFFRIQLMDYMEGWRKFHTEYFSFFITFLVTKKRTFRTLLTCTFICLLLNSFDLRRYSSNSRKLYTLGCYVVDVSRSAEGRLFLFSSFPCRKLLWLVFLNFQLPAKMLELWLNFVQENWLRGHTWCLHWKWLICFRIWCRTFPQKMWVLRLKDLQILWLIGHSWIPKITHFWGSK